MSLSREQQSRAARAFVKQELTRTVEGAAMLEDVDWTMRLDTNFVTIFAIFTELYGHRADCLDQFAELIKLTARSWKERPAHLRAQDKKSELDKQWYQSNRMMGGVCYVDRYAGDLEGVRKKIPYFQELGLTYLHLMPLFLTPEPLSDGGYAVSSYRAVKPSLGTMEQLRSLALDLHEAGIGLVLDLVFNHTSNEHEWAQKALAGDPEYEQYYWIFPNRMVPEAFERTTREIFPDDHRGSFVEISNGRWVWSTFYHYQWDLNYSNPAVFRAMTAEMLFLANIGVDFFRMDAVAFIWKQMGTTCESLPEAHKLLRAFNSICRIAAPSVLFKSEAIVHPNEVVQYIDPYECQLSYNPLQMALTWESFATRRVSLLAQAITRRHAIHPECTWVNYVRSHDDIGWTFSDEDAAELGINGTHHRRFLNAFYVARHPGSFARGVPFQDNPRTGDCRISGTTASLAGLELGERAPIARILLAYSLALSTGGIPLVYLGDEVGMPNDYAYLADDAKRQDSRWVHRPAYPDALYARRHDPSTVPGAIYMGLRKLIELRRTNDAFAGGNASDFYTGNEHILGYQRRAANVTILCLANFGDGMEGVPRERFMGVPGRVWDLVEGREVDVGERGVVLESLKFVWLKY